MKTYVPIDFYPAPLSLSSGQKRRIRSLVQRGLAGEKIYYTVPRRSLVPLFVILLLCIGIGCAAASPEIRQTAVQTAARLTQAIEEFFTPEEEETEISEETELPETHTEPSVTEIDTSVTVGDVQLTVDKAIRVKNGLYFHLQLEHLTNRFAGDILQFDTLALALNADPDNTYKNKDVWRDIMTLQWGETGIMAGEVFVLLRDEVSRSAVSYWLFVGNEQPAAGQYRLQIGRLFGCDTASAEFVCTEYGDFEVIFTLAEIPEITPATRLTPMSVFTIGGMEYTLDDIDIAPLQITVEITCGRDTTFSPNGYPEAQLTPVHKLYGMFDAARAMELTGLERDDLYGQQYELIPDFGEAALQYSTICYSYSFHREEAEQDTVFFTFSMEEPILPDVLKKLVLEKRIGGQTVVIWEGE
ncbi:MAG: hypothetical protein E7631_10675 [Ruminococcaceae bacterium]|nr:hypothetical protein [Oscillospiraceae bacterium]